VEEGTVSRSFWVYILAGESAATYVGVTNDIGRRLREHKENLVPGFSAKYNVTRLVYFEVFGDPRDAIAREKEIKGWRRSKKVALIEEKNPTWKDLSADW
jgi:putative endonuclease